MWWKNDSTYQGNHQHFDLGFNSPLAEAEHCVILSDHLKGKLKNYISSVDNFYGRNIVRSDWLNSYDNPDYLWLAYELENIRQMYNKSQCNPETGCVLPGRGQIPYVQIHLTQNAMSDCDVYPSSTLNEYDSEINPHYVIRFEHSFLKAFLNYLFAIFDDNPQQFITHKGVNHVLYQHKAPIYRQVPFNKYFDCRHDLPGIMIHKAVQMLLAHELAHVGGGHLDLKTTDPEYGKLRDTVLVEEDDADAQAICWVMGIRFLEAPGTQLEITLDDLYQEMALSVFSIYMLFTWNYSKDMRIWSDSVMEKYHRSNQDHLPYQLRAFNLINICCSRMEKLGIWSERDQIISADGKPITAIFMNDAFREALNMIDAFERSFHMFYAHTENIYELALNEEFEELRRACMQEYNAPSFLTKENIPWLLGYEDAAQEELERLHNLWPEVRAKLIANGTYCVPKAVAPWVPLK